MSPDPDASLARLRRVAWGAVVVFTLGGLAFGLPYFLGVLAGGVLAMVNFDTLGRLVGKLTGDKPALWSWLSVFGLLFRYILLCLALFVIISVWHANVVALALGFSAPVAAVLVECGLYAYRESKADREPKRSVENTQ